MSDELKIAIEAAKAAGNIALKQFKSIRKKDTVFKDDNSPVTKADLEAEEIIKHKILSNYPDHEVISEESNSQVQKYENVWIVDPIDGTREFISGIEQWGILIAYARQRQIRLGVAYFPFIDELICAEVGKGTFINNQKLSVSSNDLLKKAFIGHSPVKFFKDDELTSLMSCTKKAGPSRCYSTSFSGRCLLKGGMDAYIASSSNKIWDNAALVPIIEGAGGKVTDWEGKSLDIRKINSPVIMSNGLLHDEILKTLNL